MERRLLSSGAMQRSRFAVAVTAIAGFLTAGAARAASLVDAGSVLLPGRGLAVSWSPDGTSLATGGHFKDATTRLRYDTRIVDVPGLRLAKSFACHGWWVVATAWQQNPYLGSVIADGAGDHSIRLWKATAPGSTTCIPYQAKAAEGSIKMIANQNGWTTSLAFSPDGRWLATANRDRALRIIRLAPGADQYKVVKLWYVAGTGNLTSVRWSPDGGRLLVAERQGSVMEWRFDPSRDLWDPARIAEFAKVGWSGQPAWYVDNADVLAPTPLWRESGHKAIWNARYSPDGTRAAATGADGKLVVLQAVTGELLWQATPAKSGGLFGLDWSPDGRWIVAGAKNKSIYVYDAATGDLAQTVGGSGDLVTALAWSPDGSRLASVAGGQLVSLGTNQSVTGPDMRVRLWRWQ
jgi:WD40 repeat protein